MSSVCREQWDIAGLEQMRCLCALNCHPAFNNVLLVPVCEYCVGRQGASPLE